MGTRLMRVAFIVVVEKPFVKTSEKADELIALAKEKNKVLTVFHSRSPTPTHFPTSKTNPRQTEDTTATSAR